MQMNVEMILTELEIRIEKLRIFERKAETKELKKFQKIRRNEYENLKIWIESRK